MIGFLFQEKRPPLRAFFCFVSPIGNMPQLWEQAFSSPRIEQCERFLGILRWPNVNFDIVPMRFGHCPDEDPTFTIPRF